MDEILVLLNIETSYNQRLTEIDNIINEIDQDYPILNLNLVSPTLNYNQNSIIITPKGLQNSKRGGKDGIVLFGYERINKNNNLNSDNKLYSNLDSDMNNNVEESEDFLLNDFVFPIEEKENNNGLYEFPNFAIYFNTKDRNYYIKDFNTGLGALMKITKKCKMENSTLINIGSNYIVVNLEENKIIIKIFNQTILENNNKKEKNGKNCDIKQFSVGNKNKKITIGRSENCDICIDDVMLSKIHSFIEYNAEEKNFYLYDGDGKKESTNGTWIFILNPIQITDTFMFKAEHTLFVASLSNNKYNK